MNRRDFLFLAVAGVAGTMLPDWLATMAPDTWVVYRFEKSGSINYMQGTGPLSDVPVMRRYFPGYRLVYVKVI